MSNIIERLREEYQQPMRPVSKGRLLIEAAEEISRLRAALEMARKRIVYYGTISDRRHFDHDLAEVYPQIDTALSVSNGED